MREGLPFDPEWDTPPVSNERSKFQTGLDTMRDSALNRAGEALQGSIESGRAEQAGHIAIDVAERYAEKSLKLLPPGTRLVGKFVGKRLIRQLAESGHDHLSPALDRVATRMDGMDTPAALTSAPSSVDRMQDNDFWGDTPTPAHEVPLTPAEPKTLRERLHIKPKDAPAEYTSAPSSVDRIQDDDFWGDAPSTAYEVPLTPSEPKTLRERLHMKPKDVPHEPPIEPNKSPNDDMW